MSTKPSMFPPGRALGAAALLLSLACAGCAASGSLGVDQLFGDATRALRAQQLLQPQAPQLHQDKRAPTDGRTLREAMDRHVGSFKEPPPTSVIQIGVGAGGHGR